MKEIRSGDAIMARHITKDDIKPGLNFFSEDREFVQAGIWGSYEDGKKLSAHIHNRFERTADRTCEVLYVISGSLEARIYDLEENYADTVSVRQGEMLILLACGHGYRITSDNTTVLEVKNGPYAGAGKDRYRFCEK